SSLTVIRRNWHLLPYAQLLLGRGEAGLGLEGRRFPLAEAGGSDLKPAAPPLSFEPIPEALRPRYETIRRTVSEVIGPRGLSGFLRRFGFIEQGFRRAAVVATHSERSIASVLLNDGGKDLTAAPGSPLNLRSASLGSLGRRHEPRRACRHRRRLPH